MKPRTNYEYKLVEASRHMVTEDNFNDLGLEGWECVSFIQIPMRVDQAVFKRVLRDDTE